MVFQTPDGRPAGLEAFSPVAHGGRGDGRSASGSLSSSWSMVGTHPRARARGSSAHPARSGPFAKSAVSPVGLRPHGSGFGPSAHRRRRDELDVTRCRSPSIDASRCRSRGIPRARGARGGILSSNARFEPFVRASHRRLRRPPVPTGRGSRRRGRHRGAIRRPLHEADGARSSGRPRRRERLPGKSNVRKERRAYGCRRGETGRSAHRPDRREGRGGLGLPRLRAHGEHRTASNRSAPLFRTPIPISVFRRLRNTGPFLLGPFVRPGRRPAVSFSPGCARQ